LWFAAINLLLRSEGVCVCLLYMMHLAKSANAANGTEGGKGKKEDSFSLHEYSG
jgi:hypothetical protein